MKKHPRGFSAGFVMIIIALAIIVGAVYYFFWQQNNPTQSIPLSGTVTTANSGGNTYTNKKYGISFDYPNGWCVVEDTSSSLTGSDHPFTVTVSSGDCKDTSAMNRNAFSIIVDNTAASVDDATQSIKNSLSYYGLVMVDQQNMNIDGAPAVEFTMDVNKPPEYEIQTDYTVENGRGYRITYTSNDQYAAVFASLRLN